MNLCRACTAPYDRGSRIKGPRWYCDACRVVIERIQRSLFSDLRKAIECGKVPRPEAFACADCGKPACQWEHRDYFKPDDIVPVCIGCNKRRGPAETLINGVEHIILEAA